MQKQIRLIKMLPYLDKATFFTLPRIYVVLLACYRAMGSRYTYYSRSTKYTFGLRQTHLMVNIARNLLIPLVYKRFA